jgi:plasmid stabilization system protein ParE
VTRLIISENATDDIERLAAFLPETLPHEAVWTAEILFGGLEVPKTHPLIGRPIGQGLRELVISRGRSGYLALYVYDADADAVAVLALRHQREAGYG